MDVDVNRLKISVETEQEFTKTITIIDYENTKQILESVNNAILAGVKVNSIIKILNEMKELQQRHSSNNNNLKDYFE